MLGAADYAVALVILLLPVCVGIWYAVKDKHKATRTEYLLGGRQMSVIPVGMSIFITFQSAISQIGYPAEIFYYGVIYILQSLGVAASYLIGYFTIVPLMHPLQITSLYEYLKLRYKSEAVRMLSTVVGMFTTICYMALALLSPALALEASASLPLWMSIVVFGAVGTLYTAIGGIKSVVWTDVIQTVVVYVGIFAIIAKASIDVGGVAEVWRIAEEGGRINFNRLSFDPRVRHTIWGLLIGHTFVWLVNGFNQATLQRISSMRSVRDAGLAYLCSAPLILVYAIVFSLTGLVIYAYFTLHECDPFQAKLILNRNQLAPYFVLHTMSDMPGMAGLYVSAICCGALSTLSSGINALAANTVEDILPRVLQSLREGTIVFITKLLVLFYGALVIGLTYFATSLEGPVTQMGITVFGAFGSPILGIFLMGATVPWANKYGAFAGVICSLTFNLWISVGNRVHGVPIKALPTVGTEGCYNWAGISNTTTALNGLMNTSTDFLPFLGAANNSESIITSNQHTSKPFPMYEISYDWYSMFGTIVCLVVGLSVSFVTNRFWVDSRTYRCNEASSEARYIFPFLRRFWGMENPDVPCFSLSNAEVLVQKECDGKEGTEM